MLICLKNISRNLKSWWWHTLERYNKSTTIKGVQPWSWRNFFPEACKWKLCRCSRL